MGVVKLIKTFTSRKKIADEEKELKREKEEKIGENKQISFYFGGRRGEGEGPGG